MSCDTFIEKFCAILRSMLPSWERRITLRAVQFEAEHAKVLIFSCWGTSKQDDPLRRRLFDCWHTWVLLADCNLNFLWGMDFNWHIVSSLNMFCLAAFLQYLTGVQAVPGTCDDLPSTIWNSASHKCSVCAVCVHTLCLFVEEWHLSKGCRHQSWHHEVLSSLGKCLADVSVHSPEKCWTLSHVNKSARAKYALIVKFNFEIAFTNLNARRLYPANLHPVG